jgi:ribosomal protein L11 methylase PrmA
MILQIPRQLQIYVGTILTTGRMGDLDSPISSGQSEKTKEPDFGTYHHSTSVASKIRAVVKTMFTDAFASLPFRRDDELRILDVGCGLGFLSYVSAEFYKNAQITVDTFEHASLKESSL